MNRKTFFATRTRKISTITAGTLVSLFLLYVVVGFLVIAPVAKWQLQEQLPAMLKRNVTVGEIRLNPLTLRVEFYDVAVAKKDNDGNLFSVGMLEAQLSGESILVLAPIVEHVRIVKPEFNITRYKDGKLSIDDILDHQAELAKEAKENPAPKEEKVDDRIFPFKVLNLILEDGNIVFNDEKMNTVQTVSDISLAVPLASSFPKDLEKAVMPKLSMRINGASFDLDGSTYPFSNDYKTQFSFVTKDISLERYWRYVPISSPVSLTSGVMQIALNLGLSRPAGKPLELDMHGKIELRELGISKEDKTSVLTIPHLEVDLKSFVLAEKKLTIERIEIDSPYVEVHRRKDNSINWATYFVTQKKENSSIVGAASVETPTTPLSADTPVQKKTPESEPTSIADEKTTPFVVVVETFALKNGNVLFKDSAVPGTFSTTLAPVDIEVKNLSTEPDTAADVNVTIGKDKMLAVAGTVVLSPLAVDVKTSVNNLSLVQFMPYIASATPAQLGSGTLNATAKLKLATNSSSTVGIQISNGVVQLQNLALTGKGYEKAPITLKALSVDGANIDIAKQSISINKIGFSAPDITLVRSKDGIDLASLFVTPAGKNATVTSAKKAASAKMSKKSSSGSWKLLIQGISVKNGKITLNDTALKKSVVTHLKDVAITANDITLGHKPSAFTVSTGVNEKSTIKADGSFAHSPVAVDAKVDVTNVNIPDFADYLHEYSEVTIPKGTVSVSAKGKFAVPEQGEPTFSVAADVTINNVSAANKETKEPLGSVGQIAVRNAAIDSAKHSVSIDSVTIQKPSSNITREANGSLNIVRAIQGKPSAHHTKQEAKTAAVVATTKPFGISIGSIVIKNGAVTFKDASVTPNVVLDLENIAASYKKFNLHDAKASPVDFSATLHGRRISASGAVSPMATPFAIDVNLKLDEIGLKKFSPYTVKYIAYPVKTGALNAQIKLKIYQNKLNAENKFLFQDFTLGSRNANSKAPSVPIKLGLSLMRQPDGNISLNLPISGSLSDPDFKINQIITSTLVNVVVKAAVSPFSILSSLVGGLSADEAQFVVFEPGSASVSPSEHKVLSKIASVLKDKKSIRLECLGYYDPQTDVKGLRERALKMAVIKKWYDSLSSATRKNIDINTAVIPKYNYDEYLKEAYEDVPEQKDDPRPSGLLGYDDQSREKMEEYLRNSADTSHEALRELAMDRANAVRNVIIKQFPELESRVTAIQAGKNGATPIDGQKNATSSHPTSVELKVRQ